MSWTTARATLKMTETELTRRHSVRTVAHMNMVWCGVCGVVWCGVVWCGVVWCGVCVWCGVVVVVRTLCLICVLVLADQVLAPDYGRSSPCGHDLPGRVPVHTALNNPPFSSSRRR